MGSVLYVLGSWFYQRAASKCLTTLPVYRYQPSTFQQEQQEPPSVFKTYSDMFWNQTPWLGFVGSQSSNKGLINPFILGGLPTTSQTGTTRESNSFLNK